MKLVDYVKNQSGKLEGRTKHKNLVRRLLNQPRLIDINNVMKAYPEVTISNGKIVTKMDIIYFCPEDMYLIEVKTHSDSTRHRHSGVRQLKRAYDIILKKFDVSARMIEVVGRGKRKSKYREIERPIEDILKEFKLED